MKRLGAVVAAAIAGFALAVIHFSTSVTAQTCLGQFPTDSSYAAHFEGPVTMGETNHTLVITHNGQPVTAHACLDTWMVGMSGMAMTQNANLQGSGRYQVPFQFAMGGPWQANVVVTRPDGKQVSAPMMTFDVGMGGVNMPGGTMAP